MKGIDVTYLRTMIEKSSHSNSLLVTSSETIPPLFDSVPASFTLDDLIEIKDFEDAKEVRIGDTA